MSCDAVESMLLEESGRIGQTAYKKSLNSGSWSFMTKYLKQEPWLDEMGSSYNIRGLERVLPPQGSDLTFAAYNSADGACAGTSVELDPLGQTLRAVNLTRAGYNTQNFCLRQLRFGFEVQRTIDFYVSQLTDVAAWVWENHDRDEYVRIAEHKMIAYNDGTGSAVLPESSAAFPLIAPNSQLTNGILQNIWIDLNFNGGDENPLDVFQGAPVYGVLTDAVTIENLIKNNADIRQDLRWSDEKNSLLAPMGVRKSYGGFHYMYSKFPPRYTFTNGAWVRVWPYEATATTLNNKAEVSAAYKQAPYQDSIILHQDVIKKLIPGPVKLPKGMTLGQYAQSYRGDFSYRKLPLDKDCNPDEDQGFFRAQFIVGTMPVRPELGYVVRHLRCDVPADFVSCY